MCGIVFAFDYKGRAVNNRVLNTFDSQRSRGTEGFGLWDGTRDNIVRSTDEDGILKWLVEKNSHLILFHHRWPTSTPNTKGTTHPFTTRDHFKSEYIMVHNGHIQNSRSLKEEHEKLGIKYDSVMADGKFNDSEALAWDLALYLEHKQDKLKAVGAMAFIVIKLKDGKPVKMFFGRNTNPLNMLNVEEGILLSSKGQGEEITSHHLYTFDYKTHKVTDVYLNMPTNLPRSSYNWSARPYSSADDAYGWRQVKTVEKAVADKLQTKWEDKWDELEDDYDSYHLPYTDDEKAEGQTLALTMLMAAKGVFDKAYFMLEDDYEQREGEVLAGYEDYLKLRVIECAMQAIIDDPEYMTGKSISSTYKQLTLA